MWREVGKSGGKWVFLPNCAEIIVVFLGTHEHAIDEKGRLAIPARFRAELAGGMVLTRGFDRCLRVARTIADLAGSATVLREHGSNFW